MAIKYEAYTKHGQKVKGVLQTESEEDAHGMLAREDLIPYQLRRVRPRPSLVQLMPGLFRPKEQDVIDFTRQLAALLNSGIPLRRALIALQEQTSSLGLREALRQTIQDIETGRRFSEALSRHKSIFPELYLGLLRVGEATGGISPALRQLTANMQRQKTVSSKVKSALVYPGISLAVAFVAGFVLVKYSLPALTGMLSEFGGELPTATRLLISISDVFQTYAIYVAGPIFLLALLFAAGMRTALGRRLRDRVLLSLPVVGGILLGSNMFFLTTTLATLLKAGVSPIEALKLVEQGMGNVVFRARLARIIKRASEGTKLGEAFEEERGFPSILAQAIVTGEMTGNLVNTLTGLSEYYEDVTERSVSGATELIQPAIIMVVAAVVGFVAIAIVSGIYSTMGAVA